MNRMHHLPATATAQQFAALRAARTAADRAEARLNESMRVRRQRGILPAWRITSLSARIDLAPELRRRLPRTRVHLNGRPWPTAVVDHARAMIRAAAITSRCELTGDDVAPDDKAHDDPCAVAATGAAAITITGPPGTGPEDPKHALVACRHFVHIALAPRRFAVALRAALPARGHVCLDV